MRDKTTDQIGREISFMYKHQSLKPEEFAKEFPGSYDIKTDEGYVSFNIIHKEAVVQVYTWYDKSDEWFAKY